MKLKTKQIVILLVCLVLVPYLSVLSVVKATGVTYTETFATFTPSSTGWQNYDIYTTNQVPMGAVVEIQMLNGQDAASATLGIRTDGSVLNRYLVIHESEAGGTNGYTNLATVNVTTGLIQIYVDTTTSTSFNILGYWTGITFTEYMSAGIEPSSQNAWSSLDLTGYGVPANTTCLFAMANTGTAYYCDMGVRAIGSSLGRLIRVHESEPSGVNAYSNYVKANGTSYIELFHQYLASPDRYSYLMGWFGSGLDYQELWQPLDITSTSSWQAFDLSAYLDEDGRVANILTFNTDTGAEQTLGIRGGSSTTNRYYVEHEVEGYGISGVDYSVQTNSTGYVSLYSSIPAAENTYLGGYFIFSGSSGTDYPVANTGGFSVGFSEGTQWNSIIGISQAITGSWSNLPKWSALVTQSLTFGTSWNVLSKWTSQVPLTQDVAISYNVASKWASNINVAQGITTGWGSVVGWASNVGLTQSLNSVWSGLSGWFTDINLSVSLNAVWSSLTSWVSNINLAHSLGISWTALSSWATNINLSSAFSFSWSFDSITSSIHDFFINLSTSLSFSWNVIVTHFGEIDDSSLGLMLVGIMLSTVVVGACIFIFMRQKQEGST